MQTAIITGLFTLAGATLGLLGQYVLRRLGSIEPVTQQWEIKGDLPDEPGVEPVQITFAPGEPRSRDALAVTYSLEVEFFNHKELAVGLTDIRVRFLKRGTGELLLERRFAEPREVSYEHNGTHVHYTGPAQPSLNLPPRQWTSLELADMRTDEEDIGKLHESDRVELTARLPGRWRLPGFRQLRHECARL